MISHQTKILALLDSKNCPYQLYEHPPIFTVTDAKKYCREIPGAHVKNLFLRNQKKTAYWLLTVKDEKHVDLLALGKQVKAERLSFASVADLAAMLGVSPGSVTPLAIINDSGKRVKLYFDKDLLTEQTISVHPMENTATINLGLHDLLQFIAEFREEKVEFISIPYY